MDGIPYYESQARDTETVPGLTLPHGGCSMPGFDWGRVCHATCEALSCPKRASHQGWVGVAPSDAAAVQIDLCHWANYHNEILRCLQAVNTLAALTTVGVADYGSGLSINNLPVSVAFGPWELVGAGGDTLRCKYGPQNDPRKVGFASYVDNWDNYQPGAPSAPGYYETISLVTMVHMGVANVGGSTWSGRGGFVCYAIDIEEPDESGAGYFSLLSATPIDDGSRILNPSVAGQPVQLWFRTYYGASEPLMQRVRDVYPLFCARQVWTQVAPAAQAYTCFAAPHAPRYTADMTLIEKQVGGAWSAWDEAAGRLKNVPGGDSYISVLDLAGLDMSGITAARVTAWVRTDDGTGFNVCQRLCANAREDYTQSIGRAEYDGEVTHCFYCSRWPSLNPAEKAAFNGSSCLSGTCRFFSLAGGEPTNHLDGMNDIVWASPLKFQKTQVYDANSGQLCRIGCDSILSNSETALSAAGQFFCNAAYDYSRGGWPQRVFYIDPATGNQRVKGWGGFETLDGSTIVRSAAAQKTNLDNANSTATNDPDGAFTRLTRGRSGVHIFTHALQGRLGACLRFAETTLVFPLIAGSATFPDGKITLGSWDANGEPCDAGAAVYRTRLELQHGIQMQKRANVRLSGVLRTATAQALAAVSGGWRAHLTHPGTALAIPAIGGDPDVQVTRYFGGGVVLPPPGQRMTNWGCPDAIVGGSGAYAAAGCAVSFDHPSLSAFQKSLRFPITRAKSCDSVQSSNWDPSQYGGVVGLPADFLSRCRYCDSVDFRDEGGQWARIQATLNGAAPQVHIRPGCYASETVMDSAGPPAFWADQPAGSPTQLGVWSLPSSGLYFFEPNLLGHCLIGKIWQVVETSVPSVSEDLGPIQQAIMNYLEG